MLNFICLSKNVVQALSAPSSQYEVKGVGGIKTLNSSPPNP